MPKMKLPAVISYFLLKQHRCANLTAFCDVACTSMFNVLLNLVGTCSSPWSRSACRSNHTQATTHKILALLFFTFGGDNDGKWNCLLCDTSIVQWKEHTSRSNHVHAHHAEEIASKFESSRKPPCKYVETLLVDRSFRSVHSWIECVVRTLQPLPIVAKQYISETFQMG